MASLRSSEAQRKASVLLIDVQRRNSSRLRTLTCMPENDDDGLFGPGVADIRLGGCITAKAIHATRLISPTIVGAISRRRGMNDNGSRRCRNSGSKLRRMAKVRRMGYEG